MYSIEQVQCFDFLLKTIATNPQSAVHHKKPKLVIELNGILWCGDFVQTERNFIVQPYIDRIGDMENKYFETSDEEGVPMFRKAWDTYYNRSNPQRNALRRNTDLSFLFNYLNEVIAELDLNEEATPVFPHLLNPRSLDGKVELPFINLSGVDGINLVSIIETE